MANEKLVNEIIDSIMQEKTNTKPFDFLFRRTGEFHPQSNHIALGMPGTFKKIESPTVFTLNGRSPQQDLVESVLPDGIILHQEAIYNFEHMSYLMDPEKAEVFYQCKISTINKHDKPCILYLITNIDYKTDELIYKINGEAFSIKIIYISQDQIEETLNTISKIDYSKEELSEVDFVRLMHCLIFAQKKEARNVVKRVIKIFRSIKNIRQEYHIELHLGLTTMIKYHFDEEKEIRELLKMISEVMTDEELRELSTFDNQLKRYEEKLQLKDEIIEKQGEIIEEMKKELNAKNENVK